MHGWLKNAKKHWSNCRVSEGADHMDVYDGSSGELLVAARRKGGGMHCAQEDTHAKYPLSVLQAEKNLELEDKKLAAAKAKEEAEKAS